MKTQSLTKLVSVAVIILAAGLWLITGLGAVTAQEPAEDDISAQAAIGTVFSYQGRLTDGGNPANGTYDFEFRLYDALTGGNIITSTLGGVIARNDVPVANGLFTVNLDFGNAFDGKAAWLQIGVRPGTSTGAYTALNPRQALNAVPYAMHSRSANTLNAADGDPANAIYVDNSGNVGIGTSSPNFSAELHVIKEGSNSDVRVQQHGFEPMDLFSGSGVAGLWSYGNRAIVFGTNATERMRIDGAGNMGIHTTNPRQALEVHGGFRFTPYLGACAGPFSNCYGDIYYNIDSGGLVMNSQTGGTWADINLQTNGISRMFIESGGNVGMATIDPRATLDVNGGLRLSVNANDCAGSSVNCFGYIQGTGPNGLIINSHTGGTWADMNLQTNGVSRLFIESGGNVGVGTTSPAAKLDVAGAIRIQGADLAEPFMIAEAESPKPGMVVAIDPEHSGQLRLATQAYDRTVAGIISGAGDINPGLILHQDEGLTKGDHPVALTGRVYVWADASYSPIQPGDLLTTSDTPGHAMKVTDYEQAQGAILGKAMSSLAEGQGLVLVLVSLQ